MRIIINKVYYEAVTLYPLINGILCGSNIKYLNICPKLIVTFGNINLDWNSVTTSMLIAVINMIIICKDWSKIFNNIHDW